MKILLVTEKFLLGGMETRLIGQVNHLTALGHQIYLATGETNQEVIADLNVQRVYPGLNFSMEATLDDLTGIINRLQVIIREHQIDVVDAHPYLTLLPAAITAVLTNTPLFITLHSTVPFKPFYGPLHDYLFRRVILPAASKVICVSEQVSSVTSAFCPDERLQIIPNAVDVDRFSEITRLPDGPWAIVSRLDIDKTSGIHDFLIKADQTSIQQVDIFGAGSEVDHLKQFISGHVEHLKVEFKGPSYSLPDSLSAGYAGVVGMGRVAVEAMSLNLPVILLGYKNGMKCFLTDHIAQEAAWSNFAGYALPDITVEQFQRDLNNLRDDPTPYLLRNWVREHANELNVWQTYENMLAHLSPPNNRDAVMRTFDILRTFLYIPDPYFKNMDLLDMIVLAVERNDSGVLPVMNQLGQIREDLEAMREFIDNLERVNKLFTAIRRIFVPRGSRREKALKKRIH
ncbi:MAG: glycosyltransferase family 4 protein [Anaerolineaceae bacterium]|nr:glycosyltransferase family 4 protein [Anaerolineaceae bacterium]